MPSLHDRLAEINAAEDAIRDRAIISDLLAFLFLMSVLFLGYCILCPAAAQAATLAGAIQSASWMLIGGIGIAIYMILSFWAAIKIGRWFKDYPHPRESYPTDDEPYGDPVGFGKDTRP